MPDLEEIRRLSPAALDIFKKQAYERARAGDQDYSRLVSSPEYQSLFQEPNLLERATAPFRWISENITEPFGAIVHAPFTPSIKGTENLPWMQRELAEYRGWENEPKVRIPGTEWDIGTKGIAETLPWLAVPSAGGIVGKLGGIAAKGGALGKAAQVGATALKPVAAVEAIPGKVIGKVAEKVAPNALTKLTSLVSQAKTVLPEQKLLTHQERVAKLGRAMPELEKGEGEQAFINFLSKLKGEIPDVSFTPVGEAITQAERDELFNLMKGAPMMRGYDFAVGKTAFDKILKGVLPVESEIEVLEKAFGAEFAQALIKKIPPNRIQQVIDIANAPRAVLSAVDLSGLLRQGAVLTARHPIEASKTVAPMLKAFLSDKNAALVDDLIMRRPHTGLALDSKLYLAPLPSKGVTSLSKMEEAFMSRFIDKVPVIGPLVRASNRAYVTVLNDLRSRTFENTVSMWERMGETVQNIASDILAKDPKLTIQQATAMAEARLGKDYSELARFINAATGRGTLPKGLRGASPILNATLFSPHLFVSRLELPAMLASESPLVRKEAAKTLAQFLGIGTGLVSLASMAGAKTETDLRSSDFGKIRVGQTRLDIWAGYSQWSRFVTQLTTAQRKTVGGDVRELNRREVVDRFMQSKYSPAFGLLNDILRGETYMGEEVNLDTENLQRQAVQRLMPLFIQDMIDAIEQEGLEGGMIALPSVFGIGVTTYMSPVQKRKEELASQKYGVSWEEVGKQFGNLAQKQLVDSSPELQELVKKEEGQFAKTITGKADPNNRYRIETNLIEEHYKKSIDLATQEFRTTGNGVAYREKINTIMGNRRQQYELVNLNPDYAKITDYYRKPLSPDDVKRMSPKDVVRRAYNDMMFGANMYDQFGNYQFDQTDAVRQQFITQFGQEMLNYVEDYQNIKEKDMPPEFQQLKNAKSVLKPYWQVSDQMWSQFPPELKDIADQIAIAEQSDPATAKRMLFMYPQIVWIRKQIALMRKQIKMNNPDIAQALNMFY